MDRATIAEFQPTPEEPRVPLVHAGRPPRNKGMRSPADPPAIEEIVAVMRRAGDDVHGRRLRGLIVVLWQAGLRIHEALARAEADLDVRRGALFVRRGKGGRRREIGMDAWGWEQLSPWLAARLELPVGRCSASSTAPDVGGPGPAPTCASNSAGSPRRPVSGAASRRTIMPTRLLCRGGREVAVQGGSGPETVGIFRGPRGISGACRGAGSGPA
jgi:integrase